MTLGDGAGETARSLYVSRKKPIHPTSSTAIINRANSKSLASFNVITYEDNGDYK